MLNVQVFFKILLVGGLGVWLGLDMGRRRWIIGRGVEGRGESGQVLELGEGGRAGDQGLGGLTLDGKPALYHCISRVVERRFAFGPDEKEKLRTFMRMYENFSGNRILCYCFMCNHIHLLVEITPRPIGGLTDEELLGRLRWIHSEGQVALVAKELAEARHAIAAGQVKDPEGFVRAIHERFTWRMHDLSQFMKDFLQRYTQWHNGKHERTGHLWESRFKSVIVEDGVAARTMAAYIDLNPVRAGIVTDPAEYRWSSYGEAIGGGAKGNGKKARAGLVRAMRAHRGTAADDAFWKDDVAVEYRKLLLSGAGESVEERVNRSGKLEKIRVRKGMSSEELEVARAKLREAAEKQVGGVPFGMMLRCRVRHFTDGAVIGSREFVNAAFVAARDRFGPKRKDGARRMKGRGAAAAGALWSVRDLRKDV
jgi:REP element-mobilizing transposase RayT